MSTTSTDPETAGFDISAGTRWIFPENYPRRDYQFNIVQTALYNNTLVCLPTGLGKTFIAAVVMYNFWRWYPKGRVVFMAPTKPLVAQQIHACHEIMGIPSSETIELTGAVNQVKRRQAWLERRVIFATPQTFQKDLQNNIVPCELIKCIVIDEAHKALGKHSYSEIVRMLNEKNKFFRIVGLSATPGGKVDHVREVIQNLLISQLELRDDTSPDITPYTNDRQIERIVVGLGKELNEFKDRYIGIMDPHVRVLVKNHIINGNTANISKGRIFMLMKQYDGRAKGANHGVIMKTLNILLTMYHAYELLLKHGLRAFYNFYANHSDKFWLESELDLQLMLKDIQRFLGDFPVIQASPDETIPEIPKDLVFGHNKFDKLRELLDLHFKSYSEQNKSTRAIVFVEYRDIVNEVYVLLLQNRPLIRPQMFVGQAGQKQRQQIAALEDFRNNKVNVLISTSVGEEGLDVGEVDLIVCFDISTSAPTRLVQRMGRTGRKRSGRVVILLTEGKEMQTLNQAMSKKDSLNKKVLESSNIASSLYQSSPRMVPSGIEPECLSMFIKTLPKTPKGQNAKKVKPPAEKKSKKKKDAATVGPELDAVQTSTSKSDSHPKTLGGTQSSMMKFLTSNQQPKKPQTSYNQENDSGICDEFQMPVNPDNPYAFIRPTDVKILSSDSHALEFLTLCAMKKSEEETCKSQVIKIDRTWIPRRSPVDIFCDLVIPSIDDLDCLKDLTEYSGPLEVELVSDDSDRSLGSPSPIKESDRVNNSFPFANSYIESSKYAKDDDDSFLKEFGFEDLSLFNKISTPPEVSKSKSNDSIMKSTEISCFDFDDEFSFLEPGPSKSAEDGHKETDNVVVVDDVPTDELLAHVSASSEKSSVRTPAHVEIDFENILDEETESEMSETRSVKGESNIFDDLINADSSTDDDLFPEDHDITVLPAKEEEPNVTVVASPTIIQNATATPEQISAKAVSPTPLASSKRSASQSPGRVTPSKKMRIAETDPSDDDDDDLEILGTPQKYRNKAISQRDATLKPTPAVADPDSDQDLFDDIDFDETQFDFPENVLPNQNECSDNLEQKDNEDVVEIKESVNLVSDSSESPVCIGIVSKVASQDKPEIVNERLTFEELNEAANEFHQNVEKDQISVEQKSNNNKSTKLPDRSLKKENSNMSASDFNFDDWNDDSTFVPIPSEKVKVIKEGKYSRFFKTPPKKAFSQEVSSTGWISRDFKSKDIVIKPNKLSLKNSNKKLGGTLDNFISIDRKPNPGKRSESSVKLVGVAEKPGSSGKSATIFSKSTSRHKFLDLDDESEFMFSKPPSHDKKQNLEKETDLTLEKFIKGDEKPKPADNDPKIMTASCTTRPCLRLLALKKSVPVEKDGDGFAMPQNRFVEPKAITSNAVANESNKNGKENKLPRWIKNDKKKDNCMSPRFRKYHSENDLSVKRKSRKKFKARKRLACDFIDDEAEVSSDAETTDGSSADEDRAVDDSFVSYTQDVGDSVDMRAHYLQTVNKSPIRPGAFMFRKTREVPDHQIYSQPITQSQANETYMNDSFCVGDDLHHESDNDCLSLSNDSLLEDIEYNLEIERESSKRKKKSRNSMKRKNRKNRQALDSSSNSSSEDETEALRKQVLEESMLLKR